MVIALSATACNRKPASPPAAPPPTVTVAKPLLRSVIEWDEYTGRLVAVDFVEVRARVGGIIVSTHFHEGGLVRAGDLLVQIDVRPYQAELDAKLAAEAQAAAQVELANIEYKRVDGISPEARSFT